MPSLNESHQEIWRQHKATCISIAHCHIFLCVASTLSKPSMLSSTFVFFRALFKPLYHNICVHSDFLSGFSSSNWWFARPKLQCLGHVPHVLRNWTMPSERCCLNGFDHFRERKARAWGWWVVCFAYLFDEAMCLMTPLAWEYWGPSIHPRMRLSWILMTFVVFLMLLCFCSMVFCVLTCLSSFLSRWRRRSQSYNSHRRNFVGDKEPNAFKT